MACSPCLEFLKSRSNNQVPAATVAESEQHSLDAQRSVVPFEQYNIKEKKLYGDSGSEGSAADVPSEFCSEEKTAFGKDVFYDQPAPTSSFLRKWLENNSNVGEAIYEPEKAITSKDLYETEHSLPFEDPKLNFSKQIPEKKPPMASERKLPAPKSSYKVNPSSARQPVVRQTSPMVVGSGRMGYQVVAPQTPTQSRVVGSLQQQHPRSPILQSVRLPQQQSVGTRSPQQAYPQMATSQRAVVVRTMTAR